MRVTESFKYFNYQNNQQKVKSNLNDVLEQLSSGQKIKFGNEDPTAFINTLRLDQEINTLKQTTSNMNSAQKFANHTDTALNDMTKTMDRFKNRLIYAANEEHSHTSFGAIATELKSLKDHMMNLSNTSVNGEHLFGGSAVSQKPIKEDGTYVGNDKKMSALTGSNIKSAYNIPGSELFLGQDEDYSKKITSNVVLHNQAELHPNVMNAGEEANDDSKENYITAGDTIRELVGDDDNDTTPENHSFYVSGTKSSGETFKERIDVDTDITVGSLLEKIGQAYGNTSSNKVVDVGLNKGRIEIEDLQQGSSKLDFHMVSSSQSEPDIKTLINSGADIKQYVKSPYPMAPTLESVSASQDKYKPENFALNTQLRNSDGAAGPNTDLSDIFPQDATQIALNGTDTAGAGASGTVGIAGNTVSDLLDEIENQFGDVEARIGDSGQIHVTDNTDGGNFTLNMETQDGGGTAVEGFQNSYASMQTAGFEKKDNTLTSNVAQVISANNEFATESTKLSEVASNGDVEGTSFDLDYTEIGGVDRSARIIFDPSGVEVERDDGTTFSVRSHDGSNTSPNDMTYKQLQDTVGMLMTDEIPTGAGDYFDRVDDADSKADVFINDSGQLSIKDKTTTDTQMRFSMYQDDENDFSATPKEGSKLSFMSNNALTVDDVHVDMFKVLDDAIEAVENGFQRPDGSDEEMSRSVGIQNLLDQVDHIHDHTVRKHTEIGAVSQSFDYQISRNETLEVHTQTLRSETIDVDYGEAAMKLQQLQLNYQAMASSVARVQQLSLVNYL